MLTSNCAEPPTNGRIDKILCRKEIVTNRKALGWLELEGGVNFQACHIKGAAIRHHLSQEQQTAKVHSLMTSSFMNLAGVEQVILGPSSWASKTEAEPELDK